MEKVLFKNSDIYVTFDSIEIKGKQFHPLSLKHVVVSKHGTEMKDLIRGIVCLIVGLWIKFSVGWSIFGWILIVVGLAFILLNVFNVKNGKVNTSVVMIFQTTHTGPKQTESVVLNDYQKANELGDILKGIAGLA